MGDERALDFRRSHAVARDVDDVVDAAGDPIIAVSVAAGAVAGEILARIGGEIGVHEARVVAEDRARLSRPGIGDDEIAFARPLQHGAGGVDDFRNHAEERPRRRAGLELRRAGQRGDEDAAGFRLPPGVDDRAAVLADHAVIPLPRLRIDRLADRAQQTKGLAARLLDRLLAGAHQRTDRGRRSIEDVDLVLVDDFPEAAHRRIVRNALEHQGGRAVGERAVDDIGMAGHPADVGRAPVDVALVIVEDVLVGHRGEDEISAGRVDARPWGRRSNRRCRG